MSQITYNGIIEDIPMDQYIKETDGFRRRQCVNFVNDIAQKYPIQRNKKSTKVIIPMSTAKNKLEMAFIGGEIKTLEVVLNVILFHMSKNESLDTVLGDIELALTKKLETNNERFAKDYSSDQDEILSRIIEVCEQAKEEYRSKL